MRRSLVLVSCLAVAACSQQPAQVMLRGSEDFSNGKASRSLAATVPVMRPADAAKSTSAARDDTTSSAVRVDSVGISDLPPPSKAAPAKPEKHTDNSAVPGSGFIWPVRGKVISAFGPAGWGQSNDGIRIAAGAGEPVYASADGEVAFVGDQLKGYGTTVILKHAGARNTTYAHLATPSVSRYDRVKQGDVLGHVGASGTARAPQLYFSLREGTKPVDPQHYLSSTYASLR